MSPRLAAKGLHNLQTLFVLAVVIGAAPLHLSEKRGTSWAVNRG